MLNDPLFAKTILDTVSSLVLALDPEGRILVFNKQCQSKTGYTWGEVKGQFFWDILIPEKEKSLLQSEFRKIRPGGEGEKGHRFENIWLTKAGEEIIVRWENTYIADAEGNLELVLGTGTDITDEITARETLEIQTSLESILYSFSRDINQFSEENWEIPVNRSLASLSQFLGARLGMIFDFPGFLNEVTMLRSKYKYREENFFKSSRSDFFPDLNWRLIEDKLCENQVVKISGSQITEIPLVDYKPNWVLIPIQKHGNTTHVLSFYSDDFLVPLHLYVSYLVLFADLFSKVWDRILFQRELKEERDFLTKVMETSEEAITILNPDGEIVYANKSAEVILGFTQDEKYKLKYNSPKFMHRTLDGRIFSPDDQPFAVVIRTKKPVREILQTISWEGKKEKVISISGAPSFKDKEGGEIEYVIFFISDITHKIEQEKQLRESESRFQAFYQLTTEAIWITDANLHRIYDANRAFFEKFGYTSSEISSLQNIDLFTEDSWKLILAGNLTDQIPIDLIAKKRDGNLFPISAKSKIIHDKGVVQVAISIQDVSHRREINELRTYNREMTAKNELIEKQKEELVSALDRLQIAQEQLVLSEKMAALGQLIAGIAHEINNPIGAIQASNQNLRSAQMGFPQRMRVLKEIYSLIDYDTLDEMMELIRESYDTMEFISGLEARRQKKILIQKLEDASVKDAETIADSAIDLGIHEILLKYGRILNHSYASEILEIIFRQIQSLHMSKTIQVAVDRVSKIIYALKNYSHFDQLGKAMPSKVTDGIDTVLTIYQDKIKRGVNVIRLFEAEPTIYCYPDDLIHVWTNLIFNSLQAMNFKGDLTIRTFIDKEYLIVSVIDSGPGIPLEIREKIFQPFFTTKAAGEGSGMGLGIVKRVVERHQGRIHLDSKPGRTEFQVALPMNLLAMMGLDWETETK